MTRYFNIVFFLFFCFVLFFVFVFIFVFIFFLVLPRQISTMIPGNTCVSPGETLRE